jgi:F0F1-type ATP synthase membrane subunit a
LTLKLLKFVLIAAVVIGWLAVGLLVARGPQPEIIVPAEIITTIGPLNISNTLIASWTVMAIIIALSIIATRSLQVVPSGVQNFVEAVIAFLVGQVEEIAGEKNGRKFFMVVATIFIYVIVNNWFGLMPFFNAIGKTEDVNHHVFEEIYEHAHDDKVYEKREHHAAWLMENTGAMTVARSGAKAVKFEIHAGDSAAVATDRYIIFLAEEFTGFEGPENHEAAPAEADVRAALAALEADPDAPKVHLAEEGHGDGHAGDSGHHAIPSAALGIDVEHVEFPGKKLGLVIPYFRSAFSDVNNTLALGIVAFLCIEFWGFQALGFGYLKKFFNLNGIMSFVGILELLSEFIRIISFAFRLFGNIFAGEVLILMLTFLMPFLFVDIIYGLELFVGFIQASVFAMLTLVFAVGAVEHHGDEEHHDGHEGGGADAHHHGHPETGAVQAH